jgi:uncharacterized protein
VGGIPLLGLVIAVMLMLLAVSIIPNVPGPLLIWLVGSIYAISDGFDRITLLALLIMSIFTLIGSTSDIWLLYFGVQNRGGSCWGILGSIVGGILGTFFIPIPLFGSLIGALIGALAVELMRSRELYAAMRAGRGVVESYIYGVIVEFCMSLCIIVTFVASAWITA